MKKVCAWCGTVMRDGNGLSVSHGMCWGCRVETMSLVDDDMPGMLKKVLTSGVMDRHDCALWGMWIDLGSGG